MSNCTAAAAVLPTLTYFNTAGRAFPLRVALFKAFGKDGWVDERIMFDQWRALKEKTPLGSLPYLTLGDGITHVAQSDALARWAGRHSGLYPQDPTAALLCDEVCSTAMEILSKCPPAAGEEGKMARDEYSKGFMAKAFGMLESKVQDNGWFVGDDLSLADLTAYGIINMVATDDFSYIPGSYVDTYPKLKAHQDSVVSHPLVVDYLNQYPN